jgi:hypothetical protein
MANDAIANTVHFDVGGGVGAACDSGAKQHSLHKMIDVPDQKKSTPTGGKGNHANMSSQGACTALLIAEMVGHEI